MVNGVVLSRLPFTPQGGVISPLLANIALNSLDWWLDEHGLRSVRYADDFVVMCRSHPQAEEALTLVHNYLENELKLKSSPEKTHVAAFSEGFEYLGFNPSSRSMTMREKSVENFKTKIREITKRSLNLDDNLIIRVNQIACGTANYFATAFSHNRSLFRKFDRWIRMRLRCMKYKRKWKTDNRRFRLKYFRRMGLLSMQDFYPRPA